jgi:hypothetical protein
LERKSDMTIRKTGKRVSRRVLAATGLAALAGLQMFSGDASVQAHATSQAQLVIPASIQPIFSKACLDCHSNETRWPWYSRIAPASWLVKRDVDRGRHAMNLSDWVAQTGNRAGRIAGLLTAACSDVQSDRMPLPQYRLIHREANLSVVEKAAFCAWTANESRRVLNASRNSEPKLTRLQIDSPINQK